MTAGEEGFLLLTCRLGDPDRRPLTAAQLRELARRARAAARLSGEEREVTAEDLLALGYRREAAERILGLLNQKRELEYYVKKAAQAGCVPIARVNGLYPTALKRRLGGDAPACLWARGDLSVLALPGVALVGSRELGDSNRRFARQAGREAAAQGWALISGNARGADRAAQGGCLDAGGCVISIVADSLAEQPLRPGLLYLSEDGFDEAFTTPRALSRNRLIHALGRVTLVAQSGLERGGTWDGTMRNLRHGWTKVYCFDDGSDASRCLADSGAVLIGPEALKDLGKLSEPDPYFLDQ